MDFFIIRSLFATICVFISASCWAELEPISDEDMEAITGQALAEIVELIDPTPHALTAATQCPGGVPNGACGVRFMRIRSGARVELNMNIDELRLGQYYRNDQFVAAYCNDGTSNCKEGDAAFVANNLPWISQTGADFNDQNLNVLDSDVIVQNASGGAIVGGTVSPLVMINPYFEFAFDEATGALIGLRTGAESQSGHFGNYSTAGACPFNTRQDCNGGALSFSGNLYVDLGPPVLADHTGVFSVSRANTTPTIGGIGAALPPSSAQRLGDFNHRNTQEFYLSANVTPIQYPTISGDPTRQGTGPFATPGFALAITDGVSANAAIAGLGDGIPKLSNCFNGNLGAC